MTKVYGNFDQETLDNEYLISKTVPSIDPFLADYAKLSEVARDMPGCREDVSYGDRPDEVIDIFPAGDNAPVFVFIHGGYWRMLSQKESSFMAPAMVQRGIAVVSVNYTLVGDGASMPALQAAVGDRHIDVIINNAGILRRDNALGEIDYESMLEQYRVNTLGPLRVTEALRDNLTEGSKVAIVTSRVGSIEDNSSGGNYGYRASKAAVNMVGTNLMHELKPRGIAVVLLHPGLVATDTTGGTGIEPSDSARGLIQRIDELSTATSGGFWHAEGYELPW